METDCHPLAPAAEPEVTLPEYYGALTDIAVGHPAGLLAIHHGLWGSETKTDREALLRANVTLVRGCNPTLQWRVLDAG